MKYTNVLIIVIFSLFYIQTADAANPPVGCVESPVANFIYLESVSGKKHALVNSSNTYKADLKLPAGMWRDIDFYSSEDGYIGSDNSGVEGNAYKSMTFNSRGQEYVWAEASNGDCAYMNVLVQNRPTVSLQSITGGASINISVSASIDSYSINAQQGSGPTFRYTFWNENANTAETLFTTSSSITFYPQYNGAIHVTIEVSDGLYKNSIESVSYYSGGTTCTTCGPIQ